MKPKQNRARRRRPGVEPTVGLIVEGETEFHALPRLYRQRLVPGCPPLKPINLFGLGSDLTPDAIAVRVAPKVIQHQASGLQQVVVCFDREARGMCPGALAAATRDALAKRLQEKGRSITGVEVVVADRAFEAWVLADAHGLFSRGHFRKKPAFHCFEGELGRQQGKGVHELTDLLGRLYQKTADGPDLFGKVEISAARQHGTGCRGSKSLDKFLRVIGV